MAQDELYTRDRHDYLSALEVTKNLSDKKFEVLESLGFFSRRSELIAQMAQAINSPERQTVIREIKILNMEFQHIINADSSKL